MLCAFLAAAQTSPLLTTFSSPAAPPPLNPTHTRTEGLARRSYAAHLAFSSRGASPAPPAPSPLAAAGRSASGRHEVALCQQVEQMTLEATAPPPVAPTPSSASVDGESPRIAARVAASRPWFWQALGERRRREAEAARRQPSARSGGSGAGLGRHGSGADAVREVRILAGSPDEEEGGACGGPEVELAPGSVLPAAAACNGSGTSDGRRRSGAGAGAGGAADDDAGAAAEPKAAAHAVASKTFSALVRKYAGMSPEEEARQLRQARRFGRHLFNNCRRRPGAAAVTLDDFARFFPDRATAARAFDHFDKVRGGGW